MTDGNEGAFVRAMRIEMAAAQHAALIELYTWVNRMGYGSDPDLNKRAEKWAQEVEASGKAMEVLMATAEARRACPECGR